MAIIAPNLTAILGSSVAAKIMSAAGGLTNLSKMPSSHIEVKKASCYEHSINY
jgi:U4/U6 small nuclear ribonucleoprotein PRP31